jgi:type I restriction enzyme S subunit
MIKLTLRNILQDTRDGEWGKADPGPDRRLMAVIRGTDFPTVRGGDVSTVPQRYLEERHAIRKRVQPWDILIETAGGSPDRPTGRTLLLKPRLFELLGPDITCASFARFLRIDETKAEPQFVFWLLQYHYNNRELLQFHTQHTGVARFQFTTFADSFSLMLPDRSVQRRIASILGAYDDLIEVNRRRIAVLEEMARRLFEEWFVRFRLPGHAVGSLPADGSQPRGWRSVPFGSLADEVRDTVDPSDVDGATPYVGLEHIPRRSITLNEWGRADEITSLKLRFATGDVLFGKIRPYFHKVVWAPFAGISSSDAIIFRSRSEDYAALVLAVASSDQFVAHSVQTSNGTKMPRANSRVLMQYPVPLPPDALLRMFNGAVLRWVEMAATLNAANYRLASSRDLLLPRLISGELTVATAERELEDAA